MTPWLRVQPLNNDPSRFKIVGSWTVAHEDGSLRIFDSRSHAESVAAAALSEYNRRRGVWEVA